MSALCSIDGCTRPLKSKGMCNAHYLRVWKHGTADADKRRVRSTCVVDDCDRIALARGLCGRHYQRLTRLGDVSLPSTAERFWAKVDRTDDCWLWIGAQKPNGYGNFAHEGKSTIAHRYAYELLVGPIPAGLELDHPCCVRSCVNPDHLEPVTGAENVRRAVQRRTGR